MALESCDALSFVQSLAPSWHKSQQVILSEVIRALQERPTLCPTDIARSLPPGPHAKEPCSLHSRFKRLDRFLSNDRLDEGGIFARCFYLTCRFGSDPPQSVEDPPILPLLLDTTYYEPFAALIASVPCGGRGLPIALTTYHRYRLEACFPHSSVESHLSQNLIEEQFIDYVWSLVTPTLQTVAVADRGFARASLFRSLLDRKRDFVIRFDPDTWLFLPDGSSGAVEEVLPLKPGQCRWIAKGWYHKEDRVPIAVLALWEEGQEEPWYLATTLKDPNSVEVLYRWRARIECGNRDEKTGVILREGGDDHQLRSTLHLHRLLLAIVCLHWLAAISGLQAYHDLPEAKPDTPNTSEPATPLEQALPNSDNLKLLKEGPAQPPEVVPHRGPTPKLPSWMKPFAVRGPLSYVRLGMEILRAKAEDLSHLVRRAIRWVGIYLWIWRPKWRPWQVRYRLNHWWPLPS